MTCRANRAPRDAHGNYGESYVLAVDAGDDVAQATTVLGCLASLIVADGA